jgi:K+/H+ antiporter YhaU regulatory subunit KhtT
MFRDAVKTTSTYTATNNDKFDFIQDDKEQFINFKNHKTSEDEIMKVVQELFDDMDNSKALEFYYSVKKN